GRKKYTPNNSTPEEVFSDVEESSYNHNSNTSTVRSWAANF
ncbi:hypothetical protein SAMN05421785_1443, partial [Chryseobacterium gambrini]